MSTASTIASPRPSAFSVFRKRNFALLWAADFISTMGSGLTSIAASILVYRVTGSALSVGLMLMATAVPGLFIGLIAGVFVDRWDRKRIMVAAGLINAALIALVPFLLQWSVAWLYIVVMLVSAVGQFYKPALASVLPELASDDELAAANSLMTISNIGALTVGYAGVGLLATLYSIDWAFYFDAASFLLAALCIMLVHVTPLKVEDDTNIATIVRNLRGGIAFVRDTPVLRSLFLVFLPMFVAAGLNNVLLLPFTIRTLQASEFAYSMVEGLFTIAFVAGSLLMVRLVDRLHEGQWIVGSLFGMALSTMCMALAPNVSIAILWCTLCGVFNAPSYICRNLLIQRNTTREIRGRVSSAFIVTRDMAFMVGMASAGLADVFDVRMLLLGVAALLLVCGLLTLVLPGLGQPAAEWRRVLTMLRAAPPTSGLGLGRVALAADIDLLARRVPELSGLGRNRRKDLTREVRIYDVPAGTVILRHGETSDAAYFLLDGRTIASRRDNGADRVLEVHQAGDFFGEIAALHNVPRTATVITDQPTTLLQIPATIVRRMMADPQINRIVLTKMSERMTRLSMADLPRFAGVDQTSLRELRLPEAQPAA